MGTFIFNLEYLVLDDYDEDGGPGEVGRLCSFHHEPLHT